ncbi:MAG: T9SS type A sorting domain-containing protein [Flavobacteriales bacterium]
MKKVVVIYLFLMLVPFIGKAQLSIDPVITSQNFTQDTVPLGTVVNFNVKVLYTSLTPFTGTVYLVSGVDSSAGITSVDTVGFTSVVNMVNDTFSIPFTDTVTLQNGYRVGEDIIVIWPVAAGLTPLDTFRTDIFVTPIITGLNEHKELFDKVSVFPNPLSNQLTIKQLTTDLNIKQVKIYNLRGELVYHELYQQNIDVSNLPKGSYLLELELENRQRLKFKMIK